MWKWLQTWLRSLWGQPQVPDQWATQPARRVIPAGVSDDDVQFQVMMQALHTGKIVLAARQDDGSVVVTTTDDDDCED